AERERVHAALLIPEVAQTPGGRLGSGAGQRLGGEVDADHLPGDEALREPPRDATRPTADVEQAHPWPQLGQEERRGLLGRPLPVVADPRGRMPVRVRLPSRRPARHDLVPRWSKSPAEAGARIQDTATPRPPLDMTGRRPPPSRGGP